MPVHILRNKHHNIQSLLAQLCAVLDAGDDDARDAFVELLCQLATILESHFEFEERRDLFSAELAPRTSYDRIVIGVLRTHLDVTAAFGVVITMAEAGASMTETGNRLRCAMTELGRYNRSETDFVDGTTARQVGVGA